MKHYLILLVLLPSMASAQFAGDYGTRDSTLFQIAQRADGLVFVTAHYGNIRMLPLGGTRYELDRVRPQVVIEFVMDSLGKVARLHLFQKGKYTWIKDTVSPSPVGSFHQDIDRYAHLTIRQAGDSLLSDNTGLEPDGKDKYLLLDSNQHQTYTFTRNKKGSVRVLVIERTGVQVYLPRSAGALQPLVRTHAPDRHLGFSRADTLEGMPSPPRTCYDVLFYDLNVSIDPDHRSLGGTNRIRFRAVRDFDSLQLDLYPNLRIDRITYQGQALRYNREYNAVYVHFPSTVREGMTGEIEVAYGGIPVVPDPSVLAGGIIWIQDTSGKPWAESVVQGSGGSVWWPCKDLLSDKPDSMHIALTVPKGLSAISNGRFIRKQDEPGGGTRFDWYVSYPILNYDVVFYVGDYTHFSDGRADYYCLPYSLDKAKAIFGGVPALLNLYERDFGPYPFSRDGFKLVEAPYPMEHQGAVSPGPISPLPGSDYDTAEVKRTMWHESAHEWWGNSVSCADFADLWLHEAFATYAEVLAYEAFAGDKAAMDYVRSQKPANKEPIIGVYNVNYFYLGDMYSKGCLLLNTLRHVVDNDSLWFAAVRGIQEQLRYRSVTTEDVVRCFNALAGKDYTCVFDQYLRYTSIPELQWTLKGRALRYRWQADVPGFRMPVRVGHLLLPATSAWQEMELPASSDSLDIRVDPTEFYVHLARVAP